MSYRIYAICNGKEEQIFGNNEYPKSVIEEFKRQGCIIGEEGCFEKFKIKELAPILEAIDKYIIETEEHYTKCAKEENEFALKCLKREPKDSDYAVEGGWGRPLLNVVNSGCIPTANFTSHYLQGKKLNELTTCMLEVFNCSYLFIGVKLITMIGKENLTLYYNKKFDKACFELKEGIELYFEGH